MNTLDVQHCILQQFEENGFPPELCVHQEQLHDLTCNICLNILKSPRAMCSNEHFYCDDCLKNTNDTCPECRMNASGPLVESRMLNNRLDELEVYCYTTLGANMQTVGKKRKSKSKTVCEWRGKMSHLHNHLENECLFTDKKDLKMYTLEKDNKRLKIENEEHCRTHSESVNSFKKSYVDKLNKWKLKFTSETNHYRRQIDELEREVNVSNAKESLLNYEIKEKKRMLVTATDHTEQLEREKKEMSWKIERFIVERRVIDKEHVRQDAVSKVMYGLVFLGMLTDNRIVSATCVCIFLCYMLVYWLCSQLF